MTFEKKEYENKGREGRSSSYGSYGDRPRGGARGGRPDSRSGGYGSRPSFGRKPSFRKPGEDGEHRPERRFGGDGEHRPERRFDRDGGRPERRFGGDGERRPERRFDRDGGRPERRFGGDGERRPERRFGGDGECRPERRFGGDGERRPERRFDRDGERRPERRFGGNGERRPERRFDRDGGRPERRFGGDGERRPERRFDRDGGRPERRFDRDGERRSYGDRERRSYGDREREPRFEPTLIVDPIDSNVEEITEAKFIRPVDPSRRFSSETRIVPRTDLNVFPAMAPVPAVLVSTVNTLEPSDEEPLYDNILAVAWTGVVCSDPPMVSISIRPSRLSHEYLKKTEKFAISLVDKQLLNALDYSGVKSGREIDKFKYLELHKFKAPGTPEVAGVAESPLVMGCEVKQVINLGSHDMFIAEIKGVSVRNDLMDDRGAMRLDRANLVAYANGNYYRLGSRAGFFGYSVAKPDVLHRRMQKGGHAQYPANDGEQSVDLEIEQAKTNDSLTFSGKLRPYAAKPSVSEYSNVQETTQVVESVEFTENTELTAETVEHNENA